MTDLSIGSYLWGVTHVLIPGGIAIGLLLIAYSKLPELQIADEPKSQARVVSFPKRSHGDLAQPSTKLSGPISREGRAS